MDSPPLVRPLWHLRRRCSVIPFICLSAQRPPLFSPAEFSSFFLPCVSQKMETESSIQKCHPREPDAPFLSMHRPILLEPKPPLPTLNFAGQRNHPKLKACKPGPATKTQYN